jgi:hypothetical protein
MDKRQRTRRALTVFAVLLSFLIFMGSRLDSWEEIIRASLFNFIVIGPLWGISIYMLFVRRSKKAIIAATTAYLISASLLSYWHVFVFEARLGARDLQCQNNLKQIGLALRKYEQHYGCLPPAYVADAQGKPMHSWRVLLLPFLDQDELYRKYSFDQPWDGPQNSKLHQAMPAVFHCPCGSWEGYETSYVAVVGNSTAWPGARCSRTQDVRDGLENTILLVEVAGFDGLWISPRDLSIEQMDFHLNGQAGTSISSGHKRPAMLMADGNVRILGSDTQPEMLRAMLTISGGENNRGE